MAGAVVGFGSVKNAFFPASNTPIFFVDYRMPEGTDILETQRRVSELEDSVMEMPGIRHLTTTVGGGAQRFTLTLLAGRPLCQLRAVDRRNRR
ncbi:hypothetical protein HSBAA_59050 [Vreelandella sulfidaeris]|uniref:Uncharacterized protein n=1 Tax=Vreelandella sulfidaeris TaxID=115553 RepID=A0A455UK28_9GAMM|nr:hypothetical protein HSBAA_59050 [Halomonas sulfidaeris]